MNFLSSFYKFVLGLLFLAKLIFSKKYGIVEITSQNYQDMVIDGEKDAWIVAVKGAGKISRAEWENLEVNLRGLFVRVGIIDPEKDGAFIKKKVNSLFKFLLQILLVEVFCIAAFLIALQHLWIWKTLSAFFRDLLTTSFTIISFWFSEPHVSCGHVVFETIHLFVVLRFWFFARAHWRYLILSLLSFPYIFSRFMNCFFLSS